MAARARVLVLGATLACCTPSWPSAPSSSAAPSPDVSPSPPPAPACPETAAEPGPWRRPTGLVEVTPASPGRAAHLSQPFGAEPRRLRFFGAHLFDLLDKVHHEAGPSEPDRRRVICAALEAAAAAGAPVVRIWGTLKRTGSTPEIDQAADVLALVLDENARRARPLRFIVTLLNHQGGYGAPLPERSLDDQPPESAWSARRIYLDEAWRAPGEGQLAERLERLRARPEIVGSTAVLAWELVNELDTHRAVGALRGPEADALRDRFLVPATTALAASFPQPLMIGDLRGPEADYTTFARGLIGALPRETRRRLVWTSHVYVPLAAGPHELERAVRKLDLDLGLAAEHELPFILGELGQPTPGPVRFCGDGPAHDLPALFTAVLDSPAHRAVDGALFWGEGRCELPLAGTTRRITVGAGGDTADLAPGDEAARAAVRALRRLDRFRVE